MKAMTCPECVISECLLVCDWLANLRAFVLTGGDYKI